MSVVLKVPGLVGGTCTVVCDTTSQHTISWSTMLTCDVGGSELATLEPGTLNLYHFPLISPPPTPGRVDLPDIEPTPAQTTLLETLLLRLLLHERQYCDEMDESGARPIHALLIANTEPAMRVFGALIQAAPKHMLCAHGKGLFHGENCMHVLCVQRRENELCEAFGHISKALPRADVVSLLTQQADGAFFRMHPVDKYGSTPFSYACTQGMKRLVAQVYTWDLACRKMDHLAKGGDVTEVFGPASAPAAGMWETPSRDMVTAMAPVAAEAEDKLDRSPHDQSAPDKTAHGKATGYKQSVVEGVDVNDYEGFACRRTGFLPLHCLVASKMPKMIDWMLSLPDHPELHGYRADVHRRVAIAASTQNADLTPLQLAVWLGDREMVRFLLNRYSKVDWRWGSLTQKRFDLKEIDSINPGASNVMELVVHVDAPPVTRTMLGVGGKSDFMQGFLYELFVYKFDRFAKYIFYVFFIIDLVYLSLLLNLAWTYRAYCGRGLPPTVYALGPIIGLEVVTEAFIVFAWLKNNLGRRDSSRFVSGVWLLDSVDEALARVRLKSLSELRRLPWKALLTQIHEYHTDLKLISLILASLSMSVMSYSGESVQRNAVKPRISPSHPEGIYSYLDSDSETTLPSCSADWPAPDVLSCMLACAFFFHTYAFVFESLNILAKIIGFESLGRYPLFMVRMMGAVMTWFIVFLLFLGVFTVTMHLIYPVVPQFRHLSDGAIALWLLATTGEPLEGFPPRYEDMYEWQTAWPARGLIGTPNGILFSFFYFLWIYLALVLLLNLLIAMMGYEFESMKSKANLEYRLGFARRVLRVELFATRFFACFSRTFAPRMLRLGTREPGTDDYYFSFVEIGRNAEGLKVQEGEDIFADFSDDEDDGQGTTDSGGGESVPKGKSMKRFEDQIERTLERVLTRATLPGRDRDTNE